MKGKVFKRALAFTSAMAMCFGMFSYMPDKAFAEDEPSIVDEETGIVDITNNMYIEKISDRDDGETVIPTDKINNNEESNYITNDETKQADEETAAFTADDDHLNQFLPIEANEMESVRDSTQTDVVTSISQECRNAYADELISVMRSTSEYGYAFDLYDIDSDGTLELFISGGTANSNAVHIFTYVNNSVIRLTDELSSGLGSYGLLDVHNGIICSYHMAQGIENYSFWKKSGTELQPVLIAYNPLASANTQNERCKINGVEVTEEEYNQAISPYLSYDWRSVGRNYDLTLDKITQAFDMKSGKCGDNLYWEFSDDGKLTIRGYGKMYDYSWGAGAENQVPPWFDYREQITSVEFTVESEFTIGKAAFFGCSSLTEITLPDTLIEIGADAFLNCEKLSSATLLNAQTIIGKDAFGYYAFNHSKNDIESTYIKLIGYKHSTAEEYAYNNNGVGFAALDSDTKCGDNAYWSITDTGELIVSGSGDMYDYRHYTESAPWNGDITKVTINEGITKIGYDNFFECSKMTSIQIPDSVKDISEFAFSGCGDFIIYGYTGSTAEKYAKEHDIPFEYIDNSELIEFSRNPITIGNRCEQKRFIFYNGDDDIADVKWEIADESIIEIVKTEISNNYGFQDPFTNHRAITVYIKGLKPGTTTLKVTINNEHTATAKVVVDDVKLAISADRPNLYLYLNSYNDALTVNAALKSNDQVIYVDDTYEFSLEYDRSALSIVGSYVEGVGATYKITPLKKGVFNVTITDNEFGLIKIIPITVLDTLSGFSYTINNVPVSNDGMETNFNLRGMYIDKYESIISNDRCKISFDVYNHTYAYGIVDVYNKNGDYIKSVLLAPYDGLPTSIKEAVWDDPKELITEWLIEGTLLTYRQESGCCKKTHVEISDIPLGGYITITNNPSLSTPLAIVNGFDEIFSIQRVIGTLDDSSQMELMGNNLKENLPVIMTEISKDIAKNGDNKYVNDLTKKMGKAFVKNSDGISFNFNADILREFAAWIQHYDFNDAATDILVSTGFNTFESVITKFGGIFGQIIEGAFNGYEYINFYDKILSWTDVSSQPNNAIYIHVPAGGTVNCKTVSIDGDFDIYTSLNVYELSVDDEILNYLSDYLSQANLDKYAEAIEKVYPYNITLYRNGDEIQPDGKITVSIRIPSEIRIYLSDETADYFNLVRVEPNGTVTKMHTKIIDDKIIFETDHLSTYILYYDIINGSTHTHSFSSGWKYDNTSHWHECSCGEKIDVISHTEDKGTVGSTGVKTYKCTVCGYVIRTETIIPDVTQFPKTSTQDPVVQNLLDSESLTVKVENKVTGKNSKVKGTKTGENVSVNVRSENNGYFANILTTDGEFIDSVEIKAGKAKFTLKDDVEFIIVIDSYSYIEDVSSGSYLEEDSSVIDLQNHNFIIIGFAVLSTVMIFRRKRQK